MKPSLSIWHLLSKRQIDDEDFVIFYGLLRKHEFYRCILGEYSIDPDLLCNVGTQFSEFPDKTSLWEMTKLTKTAKLKTPTNTGYS